MLSITMNALIVRLWNIPMIENIALIAEQKWRSNNMKFTVIAYAEDGFPRKEMTITARDKDEAWSKAWRMFPEYHEVGVYEE